MFHGLSFTDPTRTMRVEVLVNGTATPFYTRGGEPYIEGPFGSPFELRVHNLHRTRRIEVTCGIDHSDVMRNQPARLSLMHGKVIDAGDHANFIGWRTSTTGSKAQHAQFVFARPEHSVAQLAADATGDTTPPEVGIISFAAYLEELKDEPSYYPLQGGGLKRHPVTRSDAPDLLGEGPSKTFATRGSVGTGYGATVTQTTRTIPFNREQTDPTCPDAQVAIVYESLQWLRDHDLLRSPWAQEPPRATGYAHLLGRNR